MAGLYDLQSAEIKAQVNAAMATGQRLFIVAGVADLTEYIEVPSYQVNLQDGYEEWTDNNKITHRDIVAQKAKGSFNLKFDRLQDYQAFIVVMKTYKKQNGAYDCTVYCNNTLSCINVEMFVDFELANVMPFIGAKSYDSISVSVEQRGNQYVPS